MRLNPPRGVLASGVDPRGPAAPAGMRTGDVIVKLNGQEADDARLLQRAEAPVGMTVPVTVARDGRSAELTVTPTRREAPAPGTTAVSALGMEVSSITPELRNQLQLPRDARGVVVAAVHPGSPADGHGIRPGTVIMGVHNEAVDSPGGLCPACGGTEGRRPPFRGNSRARDQWADAHHCIEFNLSYRRRALSIAL